MTRRDSYMLVFVGVIGVVAAFWLLLFAPKRNELRKLDTQVTQAQDAASSARVQAEQFSRDRLQYPQAYAALVRLGKAVPADPDVPSLLVQLNQAANDAGVNFRKINLDTDGGTASSTSAPPAPTPSQQSSSGGAQSSSGSASGSTGQTGTPSSGGGATGASGSSSAASTPAPATAVAAATVPIGTTIGPAGFPTVKMELSFEGSFFNLANFVRNVRTLVQHRNSSLLVSGRLLTIDGIAFSEGDAGFPRIKATILATAYLVPASQGLLAGATSQVPAGATATTPTPASAQAGSTAPPAAMVTP